MIRVDTDTPRPAPKAVPFHCWRRWAFHVPPAITARHRTGSLAAHAVDRNTWTEVKTNAGSPCHRHVTLTDQRQWQASLAILATNKTMYCALSLTNP
jgi:hypothetical protein